MDVENMLRDFCGAVEHHDGRRLAQLFCEDGVYHDVFYGAFAGRERIAELIDVWFYKDADDFRWDMVDTVFDGQTLYTRYLFSFRSLMPQAQHARTMFEGVSVMKIRDGRIAEYREIANVAPAFVDMNFAPERIAKLAARQGDELKKRPEMARHLA
jgi:ketosteroid isomerase-like protein